MKITYTAQERAKLEALQNKHNNTVKRLSVELDKHEEETTEYNAVIALFWQKYEAFQKENRELFKAAARRILEEVQASDESVFNQAKEAALYLIDFIRANAENPVDIVGVGEWLPDYGGLLIYDETAVTVHVGTAHAAIVDCLEPFTEVLKEKEVEALNGFIITEIKKIKIPTRPQQQDAIVKRLVNISTHTPQTYITTTDKVTANIFGTHDNKAQPHLVNGTSIKINVAKASKEPILTVVKMDYDSLQGVQISRELNTEDRRVHDAILTLYTEGGNKYVTPQMIYRIMTGDQNARLTDKQEAVIVESMEKLSYTRVSIDATAEAENYKGAKIENAKLFGNMIYTRGATAILNGTKATVYEILATPILYNYASIRNQIERFPVALLNSPTRKDVETLNLQDYLIRRLLMAKNGERFRTILYETIYKQVETENRSDGATRKKQLKVRNTVKKLMDYWKAQGYIGGYTEQTKGKGSQAYSITITGEIKLTK